MKDREEVNHVVVVGLYVVLIAAGRSPALDVPPSSKEIVAYVLTTSLVCGHHAGTRPDWRLPI